MTFAQLQALLTAANLGSFTKAARELGMSQPAVSDLIRRLEIELEVQLFNRGSRTLTLTDAGRLLLPHAQQAIASVGQGEEAVRSLNEFRGGLATFGLLRNAEYYIKSDLPLRFHELYPKVRIRLLGQNSAETAAQVASGDLDAGLVSVPIADEGLNVVPLARDEIFYATSESSLGGESVNLDVLVEKPLVLYDAHYGVADPARKQIHDLAQIRGLQLQPVVEVEYLQTALQLVSGGVGGTIICKAATQSASIPKNIKFIPFEEAIYDTLALVKRNDQMLPPATSELALMAWELLEKYHGGGRGTAEIIVDKSKLQDFFVKP